MDVIVIASQKGGVGKTTLTRSLAVAAHARYGPVALLDTDAQGSLTSWWRRRAGSEPVLVAFPPHEIADRLRLLAKAGIRQLYVDTPPSVHPEIRPVLAEADFVLVPAKPSPDDLDAVGGTLALIEELRRSFAFALTQAVPRTRLELSAVQALAQHGRLAPSIIHLRQEFPQAAVTGQTPGELNPGSPAAREIDELLTYVMTQVRKESRI